MATVSHQRPSSDNSHMDGAQATKRSFRSWLLAKRDRLLLNPEFHKWVFRLPFVRNIGQSRAQELFDICAGFVYSQVLYTCVRLELLEKLRDGPLLPNALAQMCNLPHDNMIRLLRAASALRLVEARDGNTFGLGELGAALITTPGVREMVLHHALLYADLRDPVALLRNDTGKQAMADYWPYAEGHAQNNLASSEVSAYSELMAASMPSLAETILDAYNFGQHKRLLDVGGGNGAFLRAVNERHPQLELAVFDLPAVRTHSTQAPRTPRPLEKIAVFEGNFKTDSLPEGADLISLVRILLDHDDETAAAILGAAAKAVAPGGRIVIAEPMSTANRGERVADGYFGLYLLAMGRGRARKPNEIMELASGAGLENPRLVRTNNPVLANLIVADSSQKLSK